MTFSFNKAPIWFCQWVQKFHIDNLHKLAPISCDWSKEKQAEQRKNCAEYFNRNGVTSWYNINDDQIWFDIDENDSIWLFEILRSKN